jgi:hypothetical protein
MSLQSVEPPAKPTLFFERKEFDRLMRLYGRMVALGEWRDYALATSSESCAFWVFRHASENPLYVIEKRPALAKRQGAWAVIGKGGLILKRGHELDQVLRVFEKGRFKVVD